MMRDFCVANLVEAIRSVKHGAAAAELQDEFFTRCEKLGNIPVKP